MERNMNSSAKQIQSFVLIVGLSPSLTLMAFVRRLRWSKVKNCYTTAIYIHTGGLIRFYLVIWSVLSQFKWPLLFLHHRGRGRGSRLSNCPTQSIFTNTETAMLSKLDHVRCNCEQFEVGNLVTPQHSRARRTQKTRNQLKQIGLRKYAIGQGQLNMVIKNKRGPTGSQEDLGATLRGALASLGDEEDIEEPRQVRRGANGGRMRRARGAQGRGAAPWYKVCD